MTKIGIGTKFRYTYADGNPLWEVKGARGRGTWDCEIVEGPDFLGATKVYSSEEINGSLQHEQMWRKSTDDSKEFYNRQKLGTVLHYSNGFNQYVRCVVGVNKQLLPVALVGEWRSYDLPKRDVNGEIYLGYHAQQIKEQKTFQPHASNVWEFQHRTDAKDPRLLPAVDLSVPPMTVEQAALAKKHNKLKLIRGIANQDNNPDAIFDQLREALDLPV